MKCIIPCAGQGKRMGGNTPKVLLKVGASTILEHVISTWTNVVDSYVVVVNPANAGQIRGQLRRYENVEIVVQPAPAGLADAIYQAKPYVRNRFIVSLGDCLFKGKFDEPCVDLGVGVWETRDLDEINKSYLVGVSPASGLIEDVIEKPNTTVPHGNCGMGTYFLNTSIFEYIRRAHLTDYSGGDFTLVLQRMIHAGQKISPIWFRGKYVNINTPSDIRKAEEVLHG